jgi:hypothetical protein
LINISSFLHHTDILKNSNSPGYFGNKEREGEIYTYAKNRSEGSERRKKWEIIWRVNSAQLSFVFSRDN